MAKNNTVILPILVTNRSRTVTVPLLNRIQPFQTDMSYN